MRLTVVIAGIALLISGCTPEGSPRAVDPDPTSSPSASSPSTVRTKPECRVLCISDAVVTQGQVVEVTFAPPRKHIWGISGQIWRMLPTPRRIAHFSGGPDADRLETVWPCPNCGFPDIGFYGDASWTWRVPERLDPSVYELRKEAISLGTAPIEERLTWHRVTFDVIAPDIATFEGEWVLTEGTGPDGHIPLVAGSPLTLTIRGERVGGVAACNSYGGPMTITGSRVKVGDIAQTLIGCSPRITRSETRFLRALETVDQITLSGDRLELTGPDAELIFVRGGSSR